MNLERIAVWVFGWVMGIVTCALSPRIVSVGKDLVVNYRGTHWKLTPLTRREK